MGKSCWVPVRIQQAQMMVNKVKGQNNSSKHRTYHSYCSQGVQKICVGKLLLNFSCHISSNLIFWQLPVNSVHLNHTYYSQLGYKSDQNSTLEICQLHVVWVTKIKSHPEPASCCVPCMMVCVALESMVNSLSQKSSPSISHTPIKTSCSFNSDNQRNLRSDP